MLLDDVGGSVKGENDYGYCDLHVCSPNLFFDEWLDVFWVRTNVNVEELSKTIMVIWNESYLMLEKCIRELVLAWLELCFASRLNYKRSM